MKKVLLIISLLALVPMYSIAQNGDEEYALETRYRNPVDTTTFCKSPTMLLFVHSKCKHGHLCATTRMQKALESDSLGFRKKYGIKLYVIYRDGPNEEDIQVFDAFSPINAEAAFYTERKYIGSFNEGTTTPHVIFYDGKGNVFTKTGGTIDELKDFCAEKYKHL